MTYKTKTSALSMGTKMIMFLLGITLCIAGCGKKTGDNKIKKEKEDIERKLKALQEWTQKNAKKVFFTNLGEFRTTNGKLVTFDNLLKVLSDGNPADANAASDAIDAMFKDLDHKENAIGSYMKSENGFTSWFSSKELSMRVGAMNAVLKAMKDAKAKVDGKPENFKKEEFDKIITDAEGMLKSAKKYKVDSNNVVEDSGNNDLLANDKIKKAWDAFKKDFNEAVKSYATCMGIELKEEKKEKKEGGE